MKELTMHVPVLVVTLFALLMSPPLPAAAAGEPPEAQAVAANPAPGPMELIAQGDRLLDGSRGTIDAVAAIASYEGAIAKGSTIALLRLGDIYRRGKFARADAAKALTYYRQAAAAGDAAGKLRVAEMTARGEGTKQDFEAGRAMARALADAGDASAYFALGEMYSRGDAGPVDAPAAVIAYREAADRGNINALVRLGTVYRDGTLAAADRELALDYFSRAAAGGSVAARFAIGKGYAFGQFGDAGSPVEGVKMLRELDEAGVTDAVLVLSDCYLAGRGVPRDPQTAVSVLDDAMARGNVEAGRRLVAIYRDGRPRAVRRDLARAQDYLAEVSDAMEPEALQAERLLLGAAAAASASEFESLRADFAALDPTKRPGLVRKLRVTNTNLYVFLVQSHLRDEGSYGGPINGRLNNGTIRAISRYCAQVAPRAACIRGPLSDQVVELFQPLL